MEEVKGSFLAETVDMNDIMPELTLNSHQTGSNCSMDKRQKRIVIEGYHNKQQITTVGCGSLVKESN